MGGKCGLPCTSIKSMTALKFWQSTPMKELSDQQWESLCDGCGKCCLNKLEDEDTGEIYYTSVACQLLDHSSGRCSDYKNRLERVPDCLDLRQTDSESYHWLPATCAYRLLAAGKDLPEWHHLKSEDPTLVHRATCTVKHRVICETTIDPEQLEDHIIAWTDR